MADQAITALPKKTYSGSSQIASTDYLLGIDSAEGYQMLIQDLGEYIINRATASLAGSTQTIKSAIDALNSKTKAYDYTAQSGSFLDWVSSTFTTNGEYYVVIATLNSVGLPRSSTGIATVTKRNSDFYVRATYGGKDEYITTYVSNAWTEWTKYPTRAEVDALNSKTSGFATSLGVDMNQNKTYEITTTQGYPIYFMFGQATGGSPFAVIIGGGGLTTANPTVYYQTVGSQTIIESVTAETNKIIIKFSNNYAQFTIMSRQVFTGQVKP